MLRNVYELEKAALEIRCNLLKLCSIQTIHIGGDLSIADLMTALWQYQMKYDKDCPNMELRDRFVLSKGHASAVTSLNQAAIGCFELNDILNEYATDMGRFSMHSCNLVNPYVEVSTGSLGHGLPIACGIAAALKMKHNRINRVYTIMGDGEQEEGSIWEAVMNAVKYKLGNLIAIVDCNGFQADGTVSEISGLGNIAEKYRTFGWNVCEFDGNNMSAIKENFDNLPPVEDSVPTVFICKTIKGKGVSFMENQAKWHAGRITNEQYEQCVKTLENNFNVKWRDYAREKI